jgi:threonine dehydrogenase-like Zn-dependent dehydrogenase
VRKETEIGVDVAIDAVGVLLPDALKLVRRSGRVLSFGMIETFSASIKPFDITHNGITIMTSYIDRFNFPEAIALVENCALDLEKLITHRLPLKEIHKGVELMRKGEGIKIVLFP